VVLKYHYKKRLKGSGIMNNFLKGFKSIIKNPTRYKFIGFVLPVGIMIYLLIKKPNIWITFFGFWGAIPFYLWILGSFYEENINKITKNQYNNDNAYDIQNQVSHIEKKTTVTNTTITTETIYFNNKGGHYIE